MVVKHKTCIHGHVGRHNDECGPWKVWSRLEEYGMKNDTSVLPGERIMCAKYMIFRKKKGKVTFRLGESKT